MKEFANISDLADTYNIPADSLRKTIADYNQMVAMKQTDHFGKPLGDGAPPLAELPFYGIRLWPKVHHTPGGLAIDEHARVFDLYGKPIARLFGAGEVCGGIHGASRLGSCALSECLIFGRIAGQQAARVPEQQ